MRKAVPILLLAAFPLVAWIVWVDWPDPQLKDLPWDPDAVLVLGGGDSDRVVEGMRLARSYPDVPVIVTGDGGKITRDLLQQGLEPDRLKHETTATSTVDNAVRTGALMGEARRIVLVTNWFHADRALRTFQVVHPEREFAVSFRPRGSSLNRWERECQRRERMAIFPYLLYWLAAPLLGN